MVGFLTESGQMTRSAVLTESGQMAQNRLLPDSGYFGRNRPRRAWEAKKGLRGEKIGHCTVIPAPEAQNALIVRQN